VFATLNGLPEPQTTIKSEDDEEEHEAIGENETAIANARQVEPKEYATYR